MATLHRKQGLLCDKARFVYELQCKNLTAYNAIYMGSVMS